MIAQCRSCYQGWAVAYLIRERLRNTAFLYWTILILCLKIEILLIS
ncbi:hypothetical protein HMPREF1617_00680 [Escherichia coli 908675]|nr:hypothetical protein HMPREF9533_00769 [Escherichia coli MS 60-1]ESE21804.1 hypothetical protein HMPREF1617_00680 [Escherichia coli 908675]ESE28379.1 hypothetical protein HMPREF1622_04412 [Escherichia coli A35218R]